MEIEMKREEQVALTETVVDRLNERADRVMAEPALRQSVTRRADEQRNDRYEETTLKVRVG
jgi:hypothetical protein